jgi:hypothetical protein
MSLRSLGSECYKNSVGEKELRGEGVREIHIRTNKHTQTHTHTHTHTNTHIHTLSLSLTLLPRQDFEVATSVLAAHKG